MNSHDRFIKGVKRFILAGATLAVLTSCSAMPEIEIVSKDEIRPGDYAALKIDRGWEIYQLRDDGTWREVGVSL